MKIDYIKLTLVRKRAGLTLSDVSRALQKKGFRAYSPPAIALWESGENTPRADVLATLAELYGVPMADFFCKSKKVKDLT